MMIGILPPVWVAIKEEPPPKLYHSTPPAPSSVEQPPDSVHSAGAAEANPDSGPPD